MTSASLEHLASRAPSRADRRIAQRVARRLSYYAMRPADIGHRLDELDREWPIDRMLQANAATLTLAGLLLGVLADRRWLWLPAAVAGFLLRHALGGGCPPMPVFRGMGARAAEEIALERYALKALRGDFRELPQAGAWQPALEQPGGIEPGTPAAAAVRDRAAAAMEAARR
jgi:hypothetical protein